MSGEPPHVTRDLMTKISDDVTATVLRTLDLGDERLPLAMAAAVAAVGILAAVLRRDVLDPVVGESGRSMIDHDAVLYAALLTARFALSPETAADDAHRDLERIRRS